MEGYPLGTIWPVSDFDEAQIREVYSRYGLAMYMVQVLEHCMVNAAIVMRTLPTLGAHPDAISWQATFDRAYEAGLARTYGNMVKQLEAIDEFPRFLLQRLQSAKDDRDVLAHRFFRQNDLAFMNSAGRSHMIAWCEERVELFQNLSDDVDAFITPIRERNGIPQSWIDTALDQSLQDAEKWSPDDAKRRP